MNYSYILKICGALCAPNLLPQCLSQPSYAAVIIISNLVQCLYSATGYCMLNYQNNALALNHILSLRYIVVLANYIIIMLQQLLQPIYSVSYQACVGYSMICKVNPPHFLICAVIVQYQQLQCLHYTVLTSQLIVCIYEYYQLPGSMCWLPMDALIAPSHSSHLVLYMHYQTADTQLCMVVGATLDWLYMHHLYSRCSDEDFFLPMMTFISDLCSISSFTW